MKTLQNDKTQELIDLIRATKVDHIDVYSDAGRGILIDMYCGDEQIHHEELDQLLHELLWNDTLGALMGTVHLAIEKDSLLMEWYARRDLVLEDAQWEFRRIINDLFGLPVNTDLESVFDLQLYLSVSGAVDRKVTIDKLVFLMTIEKSYLHEEGLLTKSEIRKIEKSPALRLARGWSNDAELESELVKKLRPFFRRHLVKKSTYYFSFDGGISFGMYTIENQPQFFRLVN
jgi:hypothetical protein